MVPLPYTDPGYQVPGPLLTGKEVPRGTTFDTFRGGRYEQATASGYILKRLEDDGILSHKDDCEDWEMWCREQRWPYVSVERCGEDRWEVYVNPLFAVSANDQVAILLSRVEGLLPLKDGRYYARVINRETSESIANQVVQYFLKRGFKFKP